MRIPRLPKPFFKEEGRSKGRKRAAPLGHRSRTGGANRQGREFGDGGGSFPCRSLRRGLNSVGLGFNLILRHSERLR